MEVSNLDTIEAAKRKYLEKAGKSGSIEQVRLFCMGKELKNENFLYSYDVDADKVLTVLIRKN